MIKGEYRGDPFEAEDFEDFQAVIDLRLLDVIRKLGLYRAFEDNNSDDLKEQTLKTILDHVGAIDDLLDERFEANSPSSEEG
jgi:hypothetical protein